MSPSSTPRQLNLEAGAMLSMKKSRSRTALCRMEEEQQQQGEENKDHDYQYDEELGNPRAQHAPHPWEGGGHAHPNLSGVGGVGGVDCVGEALDLNLMAMIPHEISSLTLDRLSTQDLANLQVNTHARTHTHVRTHARMKTRTLTYT